MHGIRIVTDMAGVNLAAGNVVIDHQFVIFVAIAVDIAGASAHELTPVRY